MDGKIKWYVCKRDIGITLLLMVFGFFSWPWLIEGKVDTSLAVYVYIIILVLIECVLICRNHFWIWTGIALYGITASCGLSTFLRYFNGPFTMRGIGLVGLYTLNASICLLLIVAPMAMLVLMFKKPLR